MVRAILFPGQGSQSVGMCGDIYDAFSEAKEVLLQVDDLLKRKLSDIVLLGPEDVLTRTNNAQPAIMATSAAIVTVLQKQGGIKISEVAEFAAGHSLGEYSAHFAAGSFNLATSVRLLETRGEWMQKCAEKFQSGMMALIGCDFARAEEITKEASVYGVCVIANDNGAGQIVISGDMEALLWVGENYGEYGIKRAIKLNVAGAFHSPYMKEAQEAMGSALASAEILEANIKVVSNFDLSIAADAKTIRNSLESQVTASVRWRETMEFFVQNGCRHFIEIGPGKVLSNIAKKMYPELEVSNISSVKDIENFLRG